MRARRRSPAPALQWLLAIVSGVLLTIATPGSGDQAWLAFVALAPLLVAIQGVPRRRAALLGFGTGALYWTVMATWPAPWIVGQAHIPPLQATLTGIGIVALLGAWIAAFGALLAGARQVMSGAAWVVIAASLWVALELARAHLLTGFPFNLLGATQYQQLALIQVASLTGVYGISFTVAAVNAAIAWTICRSLARDAAPTGRDAGLDVGRRSVSVARRTLHAGRGAGAVGVACVVITLGIGWLVREPAASPQPATVTVGIVQGNIDQGVKWEPAYVDSTLAIHRQLTIDAAHAGARVIVWPETSVPLHDPRDPRWASLEQLARDLDVHLVVGAPLGTEGAPHNSALLIGPSGLGGRYDKRHLMPLAEYVPFERAFGFLRLFGGPVSEFRRGGEPVLFATPFGKLATIICYEGIFPGDVRELVEGGAEILVNITNDGWFGPTPTAVQHLASVVFRAVEHRTWLIRAANTGISAIVAPDGRITSATPVFAPAVIHGAVTARRGTTFYTRYGDVFAWVTVGIAAAALIPLPARRRRPATRVEPLPAD